MQRASWRPVGGLTLVVVLLASLCTSQVARANDDIDTEIAKKHFRKASELYSGERYEEALAEFKAAQLAKPLAAFNYNIALCYDRLEKLDDAIVAYQAYLDAGAAAADVPKVKSRIVKLKERVAAYSA